MHCGKAIFWYIAESGRTMDAVAHDLGVFPQQLSRWRYTPNLKARVLVDVARVLDVDPVDIFACAMRLSDDPNSAPWE